MAMKIISKRLRTASVARKSICSEHSDTYTHLGSTAKVSEVPASSNYPTLPCDVLAKIFCYLGKFRIYLTTTIEKDVKILNHFLKLDVPDISSTALACKAWNQVLTAIENDLWLRLVRRHYPIIETLVNNTIFDEKESSTLDISENIAQVSSKWKSQFFRYHHFSRLATKLSMEENIPNDHYTTNLTPLSSYMFVVNLVCFTKNGYNVGTISHMFNSVEYVAYHGVTLDLFELKAKLSGISYDYFNVTLYVHQKQGGRQALLYAGQNEATVDGSMKIFTDFEAFESNDENLFVPKNVSARLKPISRVLVMKPGCRCSCYDYNDEDSDFFWMCSCSECLCECCKTCSPSWSCFYHFRILLEMAWAAPDWDLDEDMTNDDFLLFLENLSYQ